MHRASFLLGIQGLFAEYERAVITERLRRGSFYRVRQGQLVNPVAPYGYHYIPVGQPGAGAGRLTRSKPQWVRQIFEWYTQEELTISAIVQRLRQMGHQAPPRGRQWQFSTVQAILKRRDYTGKRTIIVPVPVPMR